ncbi:MAG TPA: S8 family serine peptidase [Anaerolineae bacterium]|nr:S8 family serine peptidase [Anaerolineae bacterium]
MSDRKHMYILSRCVILFALLVSLTSLPASAAPRPQEPIDRSSQGSERPVFEGEPVAFSAGARGGPLSASGDRVKVVIELQDDPATLVFAAVQAGGLSQAQVTDATRQQLNRIEQAQQALLAALAQLDATILYRTQRVYNGVAVLVDASRLADIAQLPGVKAIHPLVPKHIDHTSSVPLIGAPQVWDPSGTGATGQGISIGVIDSGIDYLHADFGGTGGLTGTLYLENDTTVIGDVPGFPGAKVVGGHDFVGDSYNADPDDPTYQPIPNPDPDPSDCLTGGDSAGHGTHVSGTAAGYGVNADGGTYTGPYNPGLNFDDFRIGPGVAPEAELYALRVFGCNGATDVVDLAIEWAVDPNSDGDFSDRLDVINMSLGSPLGTAYDPTAVASDNAVLAGVIVVASAGNNGDVYYFTGSPGTSSRTISVASSLDAREYFSGLRVNSPISITGVYSATYAEFGPDLSVTGPITGALAFPSDGGQNLGCATFNITNTHVISGNIALIDRGTCSFKTKVLNAQIAGAIGVVIANNTPADPITLGDDSTITETITIPAQMVYQWAGALFKTTLATDPISLTLTDEYRYAFVENDSALIDTISSFSSRGPRRDGSALKPDLTAPGDTILSADVGSGDQARNLSGTSMAAPHVAGAMALLREVNPAWTVEELKALAMNTALHDIRASAVITSPLVGPGRVGAGRIDLANAVSSPVVAYNAGGPGQVSVSFGAPEVVTSTTATRQIQLVNRGSSAVDYSVAYSGVVDVPGVAYSLSGPSINVPASGVASLVVTMTATADDMTHTRDAAVSAAGQRHWLSEEAGYVTFEPAGGGQALRLPVYAAPRPASLMTGAFLTQTITGTLEITETQVISLTGQDINPVGSTLFPPPQETSLATALELQLSSTDEVTSTGVVNHADLKYVGVTTDFEAAGAFGESIIFFGVATQRNWSTPHEVEFDIYLDTNRDGTDDFVLFNWNVGAALGGSTNDVFVSALLDLDTGDLVIQDYLNGVAANVLDTVPFNTNVMVLPVYALDLGLSEGSAAFDYHVQTFSRDAEDVVVDSTGALTYNTADPGLDFTGGISGVPLWPDLDGSTIPVAIDMPAFTAAGSQGILLLHHHNQTGRHEQALSLSGGGSTPATTTIYLPIIAR